MNNTLDFACVALATVDCPQGHGHQVYFRKEEQYPRIHVSKSLIPHMSQFYRGLLQTIDFM